MPLGGPLADFQLDASLKEVGLNITLSNSTTGVQMPVVRAYNTRSSPSKQQSVSGSERSATA